MTTSYTADDLLEQVRDGGSLGSLAITGQADASLLRHADNELRDTLVPLMLGVQEEFYERVFNTTVVSGTAAYRVNKRAALSKLNTVQWVNSDNSVLNLARIQPKQVAELAVLSTVAGMPWGYYLEGSRVVLYPTPNVAGTLRIRAFCRPSRLTTDSANFKTCGTVTPTTTLGVAVFNIALTAHGIVSGSIRDVVSSTPSFEHLAVDAVVTSVDADTISIPQSSFSTAPVAGDYLCVADYTSFVQLPVELHPSLVELTVARVLRALGKREEAADHANEAQRLVAIGIQALAPRVDGSNRKIVGGPHFRKRVPLRGGP